MSIPQQEPEPTPDPRLASIPDNWKYGPNGPIIVHPSLCFCGCYCSKSCGCTCDCVFCDEYEKQDWEHHPEVMKRLATCECAMCQKAKPGAKDRFKASV